MFGVEYLVTNGFVVQGYLLLSNTLWATVSAGPTGYASAAAACLLYFTVKLEFELRNVIDNE